MSFNISLLMKTLLSTAELWFRGVDSVRVFSNLAIRQCREKMCHRGKVMTFVHSNNK